MPPRHAPPTQQHLPPPPPQQQQPPPPPPQHQHQHQHAFGAPPPPSDPGIAPPPAQQHPYTPQNAAPREQQKHHAVLRHHPHHKHEALEYHQYNQHNLSGHANPAPVNEPSAVDPALPQHTLITPAQAAPYPLATTPGATHQHTNHNSYAPKTSVIHDLPHWFQYPLPQAPPQQHDPHGQHGMTSAMGNHPAQLPPPEPIYAQASGYGSAMSLNFSVKRKKYGRATQACSECRQRKQRCDEGKPCSSCKESDLICLYQDTSPAKTDKNMDKVLSYLEQINSHASAALDNIAGITSLSDRPRRMEQQKIKPIAAAQEELADEEELSSRIKQELDDHRTAPHKLFSLWPTILPLLKEADIDFDDGYVMEAEDRGVLRLYGRGEGIQEQDSTHPGGPANPASSEDSMSNDASSPPEGIWGYGFPAFAYPNAETPSHPCTEGGLKPNGTLDLDAATIRTLWDSYVNHMHIMHPFLDKGRTWKLIEKFISRYSPGQRSHDTFAVGSNETDRTVKRRRSNGPGGYVGISGRIITKQSVDIERSPSNAVVFLVLALGKICLHKEPLPGSVQDRALNSPLSSNTKSESTPDATIQIDSNSSSQPPLSDGSSTSNIAKNMDVIPGIAYYAKAAGTLGDQADGNDLIHAQIFLLAGLYKGQLARVKESMSWIAMAGRVIRHQLDRYKLYNDNYWTAHEDVRKQHEESQNLGIDMQQNLIVIASWTCLQLESDILAELQLPSSKIQEIEDYLLMPHYLPEDETCESDIIMFYTSQMYLRKRLNLVHRQLYGPDCLGLPPSEVRVLIRSHEIILQQWRALLPAAQKWEDSDEPPSEILSARLRAKYWGARYVINRPFLDYALHILPHVKGGSSVEDVALNVRRNPRDKADIHLFKAIKLMGEAEVMAGCRSCIEAAMQSTVAFDGVADRLIVTNIHGTAHAQFGNMLVLSATWSTKSMRRLIDAERFERLLKRTIDFLRRLSPISPTCQRDCWILKKIQGVLFGVPADEKPRN